MVSIPNIKELSNYDRLRTTSTVNDLSHDHKLEILKCFGIRTISSACGSDFRSRVIFPCNIKKLVLERCVINSGVLKTHALQKLEVLMIITCKFESTNGDEFQSEEETSDEEWVLSYDVEWEATDGDDFEREDETCDEEWEATNGDKFESEEETCDEEWELADGDVFCHLCLYDCEHLKKIPWGIGEIPTLQLIELQGCSESGVASAERIVEEQSENGNCDLKLSITNTVNW